MLCCCCSTRRCVWSLTKVIYQSRCICLCPTETLNDDAEMQLCPNVVGMRDCHLTEGLVDDWTSSLLSSVNWIIFLNACCSSLVVVDGKFGGNFWCFVNIC